MECKLDEIREVKYLENDLKAMLRAVRVANWGATYPHYDATLDKNQRVLLDRATDMYTHEPGFGWSGRQNQ